MSSPCRTIRRYRGRTFGGEIGTKNVRKLRKLAKLKPPKRQPVRQDDPAEGRIHLRQPGAPTSRPLWSIHAYASASDREAQRAEQRTEEYPHQGDDDFLKKRLYAPDRPRSRNYPGGQGRNLETKACRQRKRGPRHRRPGAAPARLSRHLTEWALAASPRPPGASKPMDFSTRQSHLNSASHNLEQVVVAIMSSGRRHLLSTPVSNRDRSDRTCGSSKGLRGTSRFPVGPRATLGRGGPGPRV